MNTLNSDRKPTTNYIPKNNLKQETYVIKWNVLFQQC